MPEFAEADGSHGYVHALSLTAYQEVKTAQLGAVKGPSRFANEWRGAAV